MFAVWLVVAFATEAVRLPTGDGAEIVLHHTAGPGAPVLLVHGVSSNHRFWDLSDEASLARWLAGRGFDVWNLDLRGHGDAERLGDGRRQSPDWDLDDYGQIDVATAIGHVRAATGDDRVHYVGHSMGGMVFAVYLATHGDEAIASAVVVGSPLDLRDPDALVALLGPGEPLVDAIRRLPTPFAAKLLAVVRRDAPLQIDVMLHNPANLAPEVERDMLRRVVSPLTRGEVAQLADMARDAEFRSADGELAWRHELAAVTAPMLFLAGRADRVVSPERVLAYHDAVGSPDKAFVVVSRADGFSGDYGHLDYCCARDAPTEVYPMIEAWLATHPAADR